MSKIMIIGDGPLVPTAYGKITYYIARELLKYGFDVSFAVNVHRGAPAYCWIEDSERRYDCKLYSSHTQRQGDMTNLNKALEAEKPDITLFIRDAVGLSPKRLATGIDISQHSELKSVSYIPIMYNTMVPDVVQSVITNSDVVVPFTDYARTVMMEAGLPYNMIHKTIYPGYDGDVFKPVRKEDPYFDVDASEIFGFVGLLDNTRKGLHALLQSFAYYLQEYNPDAMLYLHHSHATAYEVTTIQDILGIRQHLIFPKTWSRDWGMSEQQMATIYNALTSVVSASGAEGFNMPFLEAMACGIPAVGTGMPFYEWSDQILQSKSYLGADNKLSLSYIPDMRDFAYRMSLSSTTHIDTEKLKGFEWKEVGKQWKELMDHIL